MLSEPCAGLGYRSRIRFANQAGAPVFNDLERPAGVTRGDHRLMCEKGLVRNHAEVFVHRRIEDGEAARVEIRKLAGVDAARKANAAVESQSRRNLLEPFTVGPIPGDHEAKHVRRCSRSEEQVDALGSIQAPDRKHEFLVSLAAVIQILWRVRQHVGLDPG